MRSYLLILLVAAVVTFLLTPLMRDLAVKAGAMKAPSARDVHVVPTPRLGGLAMLGGATAALLVASYVPFLQEVMSGRVPWTVLGAGGLVCLVGAIDDVWGLDALTRLAAQGLAGLFLAWQGIQLVSIPFFGVTVGSGTLFLTLTVFAVVFTINAVNFLDGLDGLASGVMAIGATAFFVYTYALTRDTTPTDYSSLAAVLATVVVGICLGFLPHNIHPAQVFMGDSGAYFIGLLVAASAILVTGQIDPTVVSQARIMPAYAPLILPVAVLMIPLTDTISAVVRRVQSGRSPFAADDGHLHHQLQRLGHSHAATVVVMYLWAAAFAFGAVAVAFLPLNVAVTVTVAGLVVAGVATARPRLMAWQAHRLKRPLGLKSAPGDESAQNFGEVDGADTHGRDVDRP